jgi:hypothetical protein
MCANKSGNETHDRKPFRCLSKDLKVIGDARDSRFGQGWDLSTETVLLDWLPEPIRE